MISDHTYFPLKEETDKIIGWGIEVHKQLGFGFLEIVYKDALEYEFKTNDIIFMREKEYLISYKPPFFRTDFTQILLYLTK